MSRRPRWDGLPPEAPYPCQSKVIGQNVPGKGGGKATSCAAPLAGDRRTRVTLDHGAGLPSTMRLDLARGRIRDHKRGPLHVTGELWVAESARAVEERGVPAATDYEFPHRRAAGCCALHPYWQDVDAAIQESARWLEEGGLDPSEALQQAADQYVEQHPESLRRAQACARAALERLHRRTSETASSATLRRRRQALHAGVDLGSAEWTDTLRRVTDKKRRRRP